MTLLMRPLRAGDNVRTPTGERAQVVEPSDGNGRVLLRYLKKPAWQPPAPRGALATTGADEVRIKEDLLAFIAKRSNAK